MSYSSGVVCIPAAISGFCPSSQPVCFSPSLSTRYLRIIFCTLRPAAFAAIAPATCRWNELYANLRKEARGHGARQRPSPGRQLGGRSSRAWRAHVLPGAKLNGAFS